MAKATDQTNAERQRRYREQKRQEREQLEAVAGVHIPSENAAAMRQTRAKQRTVARVAAVAEQTGSDVDPKEAAAQLMAADEQKTHYTLENLRDALEVGRCCRIWEEIVGGYTDQEEELADWLASNPPLGWLFLRWVRSSRWASEFRDWWADHSADIAG